MTASALFLDKLRNDPRHQVLLVATGKKGSVKLRSFVQEDISISFATDYEPLFDLSFFGKANLAAQRMQAVGPRLGNIAGESLGFMGIDGGSVQSAIKSATKVLDNVKRFDKSASRLGFSGSPRISFSIPLTFLVLDENDDSRNPIMTLIDLAVPSIGGGSFGTLSSPIDKYSSLTLSVGGWFRPTGLVLKSVETKFTKQFVIETDGSNQRPLASEVMCTFETLEVTSAEDLQGWFPGARPQNDQELSVEKV